MEFWVDDGKGRGERERGGGVFFISEMCPACVLRQKTLPPFFLGDSFFIFVLGWYERGIGVFSSIFITSLPPPLALWRGQCFYFLLCVSVVRATFGAHASLQSVLL